MLQRFWMNYDYYYYSDSFKSTIIKKDPTNLYLNNIDTYFTPNTFKDGKRSEPAIASLNSFYVDFDCGRDQDGNYFPTNQVNEFKNQTRERLEHFPKYTALIETRNGYHVYCFIRAEDHHMSDDVIKIILSKLDKIDAKQDTQAAQLSEINVKLASIEEKQHQQERINLEVENLKELKDQGLGIKSVFAWLTAIGMSLVALFKN